VKVGKQLTLLGFVSEMTFEGKDGNQFIARFPTKRSWSPKCRAGTTAIAASSGRKAIFLIPWDCRKVTEKEKQIKGKSALYSTWSGYEVDRVFKLHIPKGSEDLSRLGKVIKIEYTSDKWERRGDSPGKFHLYRHIYRRPQTLFVDRVDNPRTWAIKSGQGQTLVSARGLIG